MIYPYVEKLRAVTRCPVCGENRTAFRHDTSENHLAVAFECGATYAAGDICIRYVSACQAGSRLAAAQMNDEVAANEGTGQ